MSTCSRGAISRALTHNTRLTSSRPCRQRLVSLFLAQHRIAPPGPLSASRFQRRRLNWPRYFSATGFRQSQTPDEDITNVLPTCCPGCGAFSQTIEPNEPGYYSKSRKQTRKLLASRKNANEQHDPESGGTAVSVEGDNTEDAAQQNREIEEELAAPKPLQGS